MEMRTSTDTDETIVRHILGGKRDDYRFLMQRYDAKLTRYVRSILPRTRDVDDIVQTVFIKAYTNLPAFTPSLSFSSWIYRIAHNEAVNHARSGLFRHIVSLGDWLDLGREDDTQDEMDREILARQLTDCLDGLDIKYREPLVLYYLEDKPYDEISDILRIPVRAVGVRLHRAKALMRRRCHEKITR